MQEGVARFLRGGRARGNPPGRLAEQHALGIFRKGDGRRVDWTWTLRALAAEVAELRKPEQAEGFGRLLLCALEPAGQQPELSTAAEMFLTGERDAFGWLPQRDHDDYAYAWGRPWMRPVGRWARAAGPVGAREVGDDDTPIRDGTGLHSAVYEGMQLAFEAMNHRWGGRAEDAREYTWYALSRLVGALMLGRPGLDGEEAVSLTRYLLDPSAERPAPLGMTVRTSRARPGLSADYRRGGATAVRARCGRLGRAGSRPYFDVTSFDVSPGAGPEDYDGALAGVVRRGARALSCPVSGTLRAALRRAGFRPYGSWWSIGEGAAAALAVLRPAPAF